MMKWDPVRKLPKRKTLGSTLALLTMLSYSEIIFADTEPEEIVVPQYYPTLGASPNSNGANQVFFPISQPGSQRQVLLNLNIDHPKKSSIDKLKALCGISNPKFRSQLCNEGSQPSSIPSTSPTPLSPASPSTPSNGRPKLRDQTQRPSNPVTPNSTVGTWTQLLSGQISSVTLSLLLTDGSVLILQGEDAASTQWYRLYPGSDGRYEDGTVVQVASSSYGWLFFGSALLPDGRVLVGGGEYGGAGINGSAPEGGAGTNTMEVYDPDANTWTEVTSWRNVLSGYGIYDGAIMVGPHGEILVFPVETGTAFKSDTSLSSWVQSNGNPFGGNDELSEVLLPNGKILEFDGGQNSSIYDPVQNSFGNSTGLPDELEDYQHEQGPGLLLYDGRVMGLGGSAHVNFYDPSSNTWAEGTPVPDSVRLDDAPAAVMPNGHVLLLGDTAQETVSNGQWTGDFQGPVEVFEYDPVANAYTRVSDTPFGFGTSGSFLLTMLVLPTGQVMVNDPSSNGSYLYTPQGSPNSSWKPTMSGVSVNSNGSYTITGTQLNGLTGGAYYGDDAQMATNYPIVQLTDSSGKVYYAKSSGFSTMGVATGSAVVTANFTLNTNNPAPAGTYQLRVIASGVSSDPMTFNTTTGTGGSGGTGSGSTGSGSTGSGGTGSGGTGSGGTGSGSTGSGSTGSGSTGSGSTGSGSTGSGSTGSGGTGSGSTGSGSFGSNCPVWSDSSSYTTNQVVNYQGTYYQFVGHQVGPGQNVNPTTFPVCWAQVPSCNN